MSAIESRLRRKKFAKIKAFSYSSWTEDQLKETEKLLTSAYNKYSTVKLDFVDHVVWPDNPIEPDCHPNKLLGLQMEALRKIQIYCMVYTTIQIAGPFGLARIIVTGNEKANVDAAKTRILNFIKALVDVHKFAPEQRFICFEERVINVRVKSVGGPNPLAVMIDPVDTPVPVEMLDPLRLAEVEEMIQDDQLERLEETILESLNIIRQRSQVYSMGISLGLLKLEQRLKPLHEGYYKRYEFVDMMERDDTRVTVKVEKPVQGGAELELLKRLMAATHLLSPIDHKLPSNNDIKPLFRITAILRDPANTGRNVLMQLDFEDRDDGDDNDVSRLPPKWSVLKQGEDLPSNMLDANLLFPSSGRAWHFHINASTAIRRDRLSPFLVQYANRIILDPSRARDPNFLNRYVRFPAGGPDLLRAKTERVWVFRITGTDYRLEVSQTRYGHDTTTRPTLQWFCTVRHPDWETHFHMLEKMTIGNVPDWPHTRKMFFPDDGWTYIDESKQDKRMKPENDDLDDLSPEAAAKLERKKEKREEAEKNARIGGEEVPRCEGIEAEEFNKKMSLSGKKELKPEEGLRLLVHKLIKIAAVVAGRRVE